MNSAQIRDVFEGAKIDQSWAFADKTPKDTGYITHCYHRYPAKFIPQVASRLIEKYSKDGDLIADPFGGCGTTLVESKIMRRRSVGVDINPVAVMMTDAKTTPLNPARLEEARLALLNQFEKFNKNKKVASPAHERIDYWFKPEEKKKLSYIHAQIDKLEDEKLRTFFYCGLSNILKNCSIWNQKSNKPTRDFNKTPEDPFKAFARQSKKMLRGNSDFYYALRENRATRTSCKVHCCDARDLPAKSGSVNLIVTSPPYVTSYEYADLHQLTALWFDYTQSISSFRKSFIGTAYHAAKEIHTNSSIADSIHKRLKAKHKKTAQEVATYFSDMNQVFKKSHKALKRRGKICVVIGNTSLKGQKILNAEVFTEQMLNLGFSFESLIKREIPSKTLPSVRDKITGKFTKTTNNKKMLVYPTEYILVMKKK